MTWGSYVSDVCQCLYDRISQVQLCELFGVHASLNCACFLVNVCVLMCQYEFLFLWRAFMCKGTETECIVNHEVLMLMHALLTGHMSPYSFWAQFFVCIQLKKSARK